MQGIYFPQNQKMGTSTHNTNQITYKAKKSVPIFLILLSAVFIIGVICGVFIYCGNNFSSTFLKSFVNSYVNLHNSQNIIQTAASSFFSSLLTYICLLWLAYGSLNIPIIFLIPLIKGISVGAISSYLYLSLRTDGIIMNLIEYLPWNIISAFLILLMAVCSCNSSLLLFKADILARPALKKFDTSEPLYKFISVSLASIPLSFIANVAILLK